MAKQRASIALHVVLYSSYATMPPSSMHIPLMVCNSCYHWDLSCSMTTKTYRLYDHLPYKDTIKTETHLAKVARAKNKVTNSWKNSELASYVLFSQNFAFHVEIREGLHIIPRNSVLIFTQPITALRREVCLPVPVPRVCSWAFLFHLCP